MTALTPPDPSPTTSLNRVFLTMLTALCVALVLCARGIVHAGDGMPDGPVRAITLATGTDLVRLASKVDLTVPWDRLQEALGRHMQSTSPLLATAPTMPRHTVAFAGVASVGSDSMPLMLQATAPVPPALPALPGCGRCLRGTFRPTRRRPLRILVTGDSLTGYLGPILIDDLARIAPVRGFTDTHDGTGLTRPDFVDWSVVARQQMASINPDVVVVMMGGNDFQNMVLPGGKFFLAGTQRWRKEYGRRAEICMRIWSDGGKRRVYWLSVPPARNTAWAWDDHLINVALRNAASRVPGAQFLNILRPVTDHGRYADFVNYNGQPTLVREPDGVHLNVEGSTIVANEVLRVIKREWRL